MLEPTRSPAPYTLYRTRRGVSEVTTLGGWRRVRRIAALAALVAMVPALVSFASTIAQPSNSSFFINAVEWMRSNGARGLVNKIEN